MNHFNWTQRKQKGFAHILLIVILLIGIGIAVYLTQFTQIFKPKAAESDNPPVGHSEWSFDPLIRKKCYISTGPKDETDCGGPLFNPDGTRTSIIDLWKVGFHAARLNPQRGQPGQPDELPCPALYNLTQEGNQVKMNWNREADNSYEVQLHTDFASDGKIHPCGGNNWNWFSFQDANRTYPNPFDLIADYEFWFDRAKIEPESEVRVIFGWQGYWVDANNKPKTRSIEINMLSDTNDYGRGGRYGDPRVVFFGNWTGSEDPGSQGTQVLNIDGERIGQPYIVGSPYIKLQQNNTYRVNWGQIINTFTTDGRYFEEPNARNQAQTWAVYIAVETHNISDRNSIVTDLRIKSFHLYGPGAPASPLPSPSPVQPTAQISASPNPCIVGSDGLCSTTLKLDVKGYSNLQIFANDEPMTGPGIDPTKTFETGKWISTDGVTFKLKSNGTEVASLQVKGINPNATITASPNPCIVGSDGLCSTTLTLNVQGYTDLQFFANDTPMTGVGIDPNGTFETGRWIGSAGVSFKLTSDGGKIASLDVTGVSPSATITASPNPCVIPPNKVFCKSTISWTSENAPDLQIKIKGGQPFTGAGSPIGSGETGEWIPTSGVIFEAYSGSSLLTSLNVRGVKLGDLSGDGNVDFADFNAFARDYKNKDLKADFNGNGGVDLADLNMLIRNFGK